MYLSRTHRTRNVCAVNYDEFRKRFDCASKVQWVLSFFSDRHARKQPITSLNLFVHVSYGILRIMTNIYIYCQINTNDLYLYYLHLSLKYTRSFTRIVFLPILNRIFIYSRIFRNSIYPLLLLPHLPRRTSTLYSSLSSQDYPFVISSLDIRPNHLDLFPLSFSSAIPVTFELLLNSIHMCGRPSAIAQVVCAIFTFFVR